jgi:leucyl/phenylalanyl-tRNA---protein transferase
MLTPELLLHGYAMGVFPMAEDGEILWFSPERRGVIPLDGRFHVPHGLKKRLSKRPFEVMFDTSFRNVIASCANREETWIDAQIIENYVALHEMGHAHSVECWDAEGLQGGLYGVSLGGAFFGESMFSRKTDASKIALVALVDCLRHSGFVLLDTQWLTPHLAQFGAYEISREEYALQLQCAVHLRDRVFTVPSSYRDMKI